MKIKFDRLYSEQNKKIVVIGGSSVAFGVRSDIMEQQLGLPVINFGLYANLGTKYMLDVAKDAIKPGDTVIIAPEQNSQALSLYFNGEAVWYSADGCYEILKKVPFSDGKLLFGSFFKFVSGKFGYYTSGKKPNPDGVYNAASFNAYGDIVYDRQYNTMTDGYDAATPVSFETDIIDDEFIDYINDYKRDLGKIGASVYFGFSPMNAAATVSDDAAAQAYYNHLTAKLDFPIIGNPVSHALDSDWFYDSNFHLNSAGAVYYSAMLCGEIKAAQGDYSPVTVQIPQKPEVPENQGEGTFSKDLEDAAEIFNLSGVTIKTDGEKVVFTGNWVIDGLTDHGKTLSEIVIPDTLGGVGVVAIADGAFRDCATLTKLTLGKNISSVGLGALSGCSALTSIYVTSNDPDSYHPSANILDGLDNCYFYVPQESYAGDYLVNYFWGALADRIRPY